MILMAAYIHSKAVFVMSIGWTFFNALNFLNTLLSADYY